MAEEQSFPYQMKFHVFSWILSSSHNTVYSQRPLNLLYVSNIQGHISKSGLLQMIVELQFFCIQHLCLQKVTSALRTYLVCQQIEILHKISRNFFWVLFIELNCLCNSFGSVTLIRSCHKISQYKTGSEDLS